MAQESTTDRQWERWGRQDPYRGVLEVDTVVGAGAVVSRDVPRGAIIAGMGVREITRKSSYEQ